jgi:hypothetical protein
VRQVRARQRHVLKPLDLVLLPGVLRFGRGDLCLRRLQATLQVSAVLAADLELAHGLCGRRQLLLNVIRHAVITPHPVCQTSKKPHITIRRYASY